jgi:hypothetical protein
MSMRILNTCTIVAAALATGCPSSGGGEQDDTEGVDPSAPGSDDDGGSGTAGTGPMATTGGEPTPTSGPPSTSGEPDDDTAIPEPPIDFDLGVLPDAPMLSQSCTKVDFMFVIDNSGSMGSYQANVVANFPAFIDGIQNSLEDVQSYQVGVITSDVYTPNKPGCNTALSSLVVQTDFSGSNAICGTGPGMTYADGYNFMTENDDLATTFSCAASVGTSGSGFERPMQAVVEAVQRVDGDPGECNEGYLREDALLVIVVITDEADGPGDPDGAAGTATSLGDPVSWYDDVVAAKGGIPENVVALAMVNSAGGPCPPTFPTEDGGNIATWAQMFGPNGFVGGICEPDYGPVFQQAIGVIDEACENYIPPG